MQRATADGVRLAVRGGHWLPLNDPGSVARLTRDHIRRVAPWAV